MAVSSLPSKESDLGTKPFPLPLASQADGRHYHIRYFNVFLILTFHAASVYGLYLCITSSKWQTIFFAWILYILTQIANMAGSHRLWSHRSYKAKLPLQLLLVFLQSLACQNTVREWVRKHRMHHKYSDTDADPHNATRGFFFSHIGWLMVQLHPEVKRRGKDLDISDIDSNLLLAFQSKYKYFIAVPISFVLPTLICIYCWGESLNNAWHIAVVLRQVTSMHASLSINSAAHLWGNKPYDKNIAPTQNIGVSILSLGEGFHNYHHTFPWDYRAAELGNNVFNLSGMFIDFFAWIGWAYDLKTVPEDMIKARSQRTGDGTNLWGWGDKDHSIEDMLSAKILHPKELRCL